MVTRGCLIAPPPNREHRGLQHHPESALVESGHQCGNEGLGEHTSQVSELELGSEVGAVSQVRETTRAGA